MSCADELARLLSRASTESGVRCPLPKAITRRQTLVSYTDGGPFVYTIQEAGVLVQLAADYLSRSTERYGYVALERSALSLVARLDSGAGSPEAYLIARSVYNLAADGHFGREFGEFVEFEGFGVEVDIELLPSGQVSEEMESLVRAMPARGPSPLDRLAEWQLASKASKEGKVYDRDHVFQTMCNNKNKTPMPDQASISVYSRQASQATLRRLRSLDVEKGTGTMFMEPFVTRPDDTKADATTLGSYTTLGNEARGPKKGITIAFPAADPICVYGATEHWLLAGDERVWVHLHRRKYVFAAHGVTIPNAMGGAFALLREIYAPVSGAGSGSVSVSVSGGAVSGNPQESASRAWRARGVSCDVHVARSADSFAYPGGVLCRRDRRVEWRPTTGWSRHVRSARARRGRRYHAQGDAACARHRFRRIVRCEAPCGSQQNAERVRPHDRESRSPAAERHPGRRGFVHRARAHARSVSC